MSFTSGDKRAISEDKQPPWDVERRRLKREMEIKDDAIEDLTRDLRLSKDAEAKALKRFERALEYTREVEEKLDHLRSCFDDEREELMSKLKELKETLMKKDEELMNLKAEKDERIEELIRVNEDLRSSRDEIVYDLSSQIQMLLEMLNHKDWEASLCEFNDSAFVSRANYVKCSLVASKEAAKTTVVSEEELSGVNGVACNQKSQSPEYIQMSGSDDDEVSCHANASLCYRSDYKFSTSHKQKVPVIRECEDKLNRKMKTPGLEANDCENVTTSKKTDVLEYTSKCQQKLEKNVLECLADVAVDSEKDAEFCAEGVCAQHRNGLHSPGRRGYEKRCIGRAAARAEHLVDSDRNSDKKSGNELKHQDPGRLNTCRKLALNINMAKSHEKAVEQFMEKSSSVILERVRKILDDRPTDKVSHKRVKTMKTQPTLPTKERQQSLKVNTPHLVKEPTMCYKFITKCRPRRLVELINHLNPKQMEAVRQIGFGGLLHVKVTSMPQGILPWLISAFCDRSHMFTVSATKEFLLSKDDVHDFFGLPRGPNKVDLVATGNSKLSSQEDLKDVWRSKFGIVGTKDGISLSKAYAKLLNSKDGGVEFKRLFVLYTMSSFLAPTSNHVLDFKLLRAVQDVRQIRQLDWCSYVFDNLVTAISSCRTGRSLMCGCTLFLMLAYFHRFDFHGEVQPFSLPLIQHWTDEKLSDRVNRESHTGCLGNAPLTQVLYPICVNYPPTPAESKLNDAQPSGFGVRP
ncbi:hypothetical protein RND81_05G045000 [Saponaria officinalis]|uniref:Uncharacterized protein n=1 Tax=Saponaria officinalis TaxID=3572 RepID=A0AAW1KU89_SAPOF